MSNIFELLDNKYDISNQVKNLNSLLNERCIYKIGYYSPISIKEVFDKYIIKKWKHRKGRLNVDQILNDIGLDFSLEKAPIDLEKSLLFFELLDNIIYLIYNTMHNENLVWKENEELNVQINAIISDMNYNLDKLGYEFHLNKKEDYFHVKVKNGKAKKVSLGLKGKDLILKIYEYDYIENKKDIVKKKEILSSLANYIEPILLDKRIIGDNNKNKKLGEDDKKEKSDLYGIIDNCSFALNNLNIRHNNVDPTIPKHYNKFTEDMSKEELLSWYDKTFDLILDCILAKDYLDSKQSWSELRKNYK